MHDPTALATALDSFRACFSSSRAWRAWSRR